MQGPGLQLQLFREKKLKMSQDEASELTHPLPLGEGLPALRALQWEAARVRSRDDRDKEAAGTEG